MLATYLLQFLGLPRLGVQLSEGAPAVKGKDSGFFRRVAISEGAELYVVLFLYLPARNSEVAILAIFQSSVFLATLPLVNSLLMALIVRLIPFTEEELRFFNTGSTLCAVVRMEFSSLVLWPSSFCMR